MVNNSYHRVDVVFR